MSSRGLRETFDRETGKTEYTVYNYKNRCFEWRQGLLRCTFEHDDGKIPALSVVCMQYAEALRAENEIDFVNRNSKDFIPLARKLGYTDNDRKEKARELVEQFFQENPFSKMFEDMRQGLLLIGGCGSGKTYMAAAIANELCEAKQNVVMIQQDELRDFIRDSAGVENDTSDECAIGLYLDKYYEKDCGILIIDDLFARTDKKSNEFALLLFDMMTSYDGLGFEIVVTANLTKEEMINPPPDKARIISRLRELCTVVETGTRDRRSLVMASCMNPQSNGEHSEQAKKNSIPENRKKNDNEKDSSHKNDDNDPEPPRGSPEWYAWADRHDPDDDTYEGEQ